MYSINNWVFVARLCNKIALNWKMCCTILCIVCMNMGNTIGQEMKVDNFTQ